MFNLFMCDYFSDISNKFICGAIYKNSFKNLIIIEIFIRLMDIIWNKIIKKLKIL